MNCFQRFVMWMIGLNPYLYDSKQPRSWYAVRGGLTDLEKGAIDSVFKSESENPNSGVSKYLYKNRDREVRISEFIIHMMRNFK